MHLTELYDTHSFNILNWWLNREINLSAILTGFSFLFEWEIATKNFIKTQRLYTASYTQKETNMDFDTTCSTM